MVQNDVVQRMCIIITARAASAGEGTARRQSGAITTAGDWIGLCQVSHNETTVVEPLARHRRHITSFTVPPMRFTFARISFTLPLLLACRGAALSPAQEIVPGEPVQLTAGQSATVRGTPVRLRLDAISDSRCPSDVQCVWAGEAATVLTLTGAGDTRTDTLKLKNTPQTVTYGDYRITLLDVQPKPHTQQDPALKSATLTVSAP
jgi:hypothetical protein